MKINTVKAFAVGLLTAATLFAGPAVVAQPAQQAQEGVNKIGGEQSTVSLEEAIKTGIDVFLYFIGALAVIMIIYGGFRYITSRGDATAVASAKNTLMYAVIGLVVVVLAGTIADFVVNSIWDGPSVNTEIPSDCTDAQVTGANC